MIRALFSAAAGMQAQQLNLDNIANNLANVNTAGFKRSRIDFQDLFYQSFRPAGASTASGAEIPVGIQVGHGSKPVATQRIYVQGEPQETENPLDLMIEGDGFFQVLGCSPMSPTRASRTRRWSAPAAMAGSTRSIAPTA